MRAIAPRRSARCGTQPSANPALNVAATNDGAAPSNAEEIDPLREAALADFGGTGSDFSPAVWLGDSRHLVQLCAAGVPSKQIAIRP